MKELIDQFDRYVIPIANWIKPVMEAQIKNDFDLDINLPDGNAIVAGGWEDTFQISTSKIGPMKLMIAFLEVSIQIAVAKDLTFFQYRYEFSYKHPGGGSNGFRILKKYVKENYRWIEEIY